MNLRSTIPWSTVALVLAAGAALQAQEQTGALTGLALGPGGKPVAGARITLESPALFAPRTALSNERGEWRVPLLPVGNYTVRIVKDGFLGPVVKNLRVGLGSNQRLDLALRPVVDAGATVEVVAPLVALSAAEVKVATNISGEALWRLPVVASGGGGVFEQARIISPGVVTDNNNSKNGIRGVGGDGIGYFMDGVDIKDNGSNAFAPIADFVEDVMVVQSPINAANGRVSGGQVKVVTKSGGNEFAGSVRAVYNRASERAGWFAADAGYIADQSRDRIARTWNLTASGPLWKDHIWFSVANQRVAGSTGVVTLFPASAGNTNYPLMPAPNVGGTGYPFEAGLTSVAARLRAIPSGSTIPTWDLGSTLQNSGDSSFWDTKITAAVFDDHVVTVSTSYRRSSTRLTAADFGPFGATQYWLQASQYGPGATLRNSYSVNYRGSITPRLQVEAQQGAYKFEAKSYSAPDPANYPTKVYAALSNGTFGTGYSSYGPVPLFGTNGQDQVRRNLNQSLRFKLLAEARGSHEIDFGIENVAMRNNPGYPDASRLNRVLVGGYFVDAAGAFSFPTVRFWAPTANGQQAVSLATMISGDNFTKVGPAPMYMNFYAGSADMVDRTRVVYVNDTWVTGPHWAFTAGLRFSRFSVENTDGSSVLTTNMPEPRFQAKWDPTGKGTHVFALSLARYAQEFTTNATSPWIIAPSTVFTIRGWAGIGGQPLPGDPTDGTNYGVRNVPYAQLVDPNNYLPTHYFRDARQQLSIDPGLKPSYRDEVGLNYRRSFQGGYVNMALTESTYRNTLLNAVDYGLENFQVVKDPSGQGAASKRIQLTRYLNSPYQTKFRTFELSWQQAVTTRLRFDGSYSYFRQTGVSETGVLNYLSLRNNTAYGLSAQERLPEGLLLRMQKAKIAWTYTHPVKGGDIAIALLGDYMHDPGVGALGASMLYRYIKDGAGNVILQPMPTVDANGLSVQAITDPSFTRYYSPMGAYRANNDTYSASLKVDWRIPIGLARTQLIGSLQIINIFNQGTNFTPPYFGGAAGTTDGIPGRLMYTYTYVPGSNGTFTGTSERSLWNQARTFSEITMGLRF